MYRRVLTGMAVSLVIGLLAAACGGDEPTATPAPTTAPTATRAPSPTATTAASPTSAPAATPTSAPVATPTARPTTPPVTPTSAATTGGELKVLTIRGPRSQDPILFATMGDLGMIRPMFSGLLEFGPGGWDTIEPKLAEKWAVGSDGKTVTFQLRSGLKWHDGQPITSQDVKYTLESTAKPKSGATIYEEEAKTIASIETPSATQVVVTVKASPTVLLHFLAGSVIAPKAFHEANQPVATFKGYGNGPFKLSDVQPNVSFSYVKNTDYFIPGRPYLDKVTYQIVPDIGARQTAIRTGRAHTDWVLWTGAAQAQIEALEKEGVDVEESVLVNMYSVLPNHERKDGPWADVRVRKALNLAIDREAILKGTRAGVHGAFFYPPPFGGDTPDQLAKRPGYSGDMAARIAQAKQLLAEAGRPNGFDTEFVIASTNPYPDIAALLQEQYKKIGVNLTLKTDTGAVVPVILREGRYSMAVTSGFSSTNFPWALVSRYSTDGTRNDSGYSSADVDRLLQQFMAEPDVKKQQAILGQLKDKLWEDLPEIPLMAGTGLYMRRLEVQGVELKLFGAQAHPEKSFEQAWLKK